MEMEKIELKFNNMIEPFESITAFIIDSTSISLLLAIDKYDFNVRLNHLPENQKFVIGGLIPKTYEIIGINEYPVLKNFYKEMITIDLILDGLSDGKIEKAFNTYVSSTNASRYYPEGERGIELVNTEQIKNTSTNK
jgi:hypothetical protein